MTSSSSASSGWPWTCAGSSLHGDRVWPSSIRSCCWMRASMASRHPAAEPGWFRPPPSAARLPRWLALAGRVRSHWRRPRIIPRLPPFPSPHAFGLACSPGMDFHFLLCRRSRRAFLPRMDANLLARRVWPVRALLITATLFGLSHFNKRAVHFNRRYVVLALLAGIFYGRAWLQDRRVGASAITHASVDTIWSIWLR